MIVPSEATSATAGFSDLYVITGLTREDSPAFTETVGATNDSSSPLFTTIVFWSLLPNERIVFVFLDKEYVTSTVCNLICPEVPPL